MFLSILTFLTAISISFVAIYYSVAGLVAIFAAAAIPVMIMGTSLEVAKLVAVVWLHRYWNHAVWWLKSYLLLAIAVLMLISSLGIFGFLSKAHIEQTAVATQSIAVIEQINVQLLRDQQTIDRAEALIQQLESQSSNQDVQIQDQIDREQQRIDLAYARIQPAIDEQNQVINRSNEQTQTRIDEVRQELAVIDQQLSALQSALENNNVRLAQSIVGTRQDGSLGPGTQQAIQQFRAQKAAQRQSIIDRIEQIVGTVDPRAEQARTEIQRLRQFAESEIRDSGQLISRLRSQLGTVDTQEQQQLIEQQQSIIQNAQARIEQNIQRKFDLESEYRMLEAEVGPIKYLAEFIYGDTADANLLEEAVRWVIVLIIFVFDPLAVLLLIASQYSFKIYQENKPKPVTSDKETAKHSQPIINNIDDNEFIANPDTEPVINSDETFSQYVDEKNELEIEPIPSVDIDIDLQHKDLNSRAADLAEKESDERWKLARIRWKIDNPRANTKTIRQMYLDGAIDQLPWENYFTTSNTYVQNSEQDENSLFNKIQKSKNE
jgi:peptidoglycan hydrolase-like protein with peptidoglycan-binding domain